MIKKIAMATSVLTLVGLVGGCCSRNETRAVPANEVAIVQTHNYEDVTKLTANMTQTYGAKESLGAVRFAEKDSGLQMHLDMKHGRPGHDYTLAAYNAKGKLIDSKFPTFRPDADGRFNESFLMTGVSASYLKDSKLILIREQDGESIKVGAGKLKENMFF